MVYTILNIPMVYRKKGNVFMGTLWIALERLTVLPAPTKELMKDYLLFSEYFCPPEYRADNFGLNPWFFDKDNKLVSLGGKMGEPEIWYRHIKKFLEKRGFQLIGDPKIVSENDVEINVRHLEYERSIARFNDRNILGQMYLDDDDIKVSEYATDNDDN
jgi:hypothetical protein